MKLLKTTPMFWVPSHTSCTEDTALEALRELFKPGIESPPAELVNTWQPPLVPTNHGFSGMKEAIQAAGIELSNFLQTQSEGDSKTSNLIVTALQLHQDMTLRLLAQYTSLSEASSIGLLQTVASLAKDDRLSRRYLQEAILHQFRAQDLQIGLHSMELSQRLERLDTRYKEVEQESQDRSGRMVEEIVELRKKLTEQENRLVHLHRQADAAEVRNDQTEMRLITYSSDIIDLTRQLNVLEGFHQRSVGDLETKIDEKFQNLCTLREDLDEHQRSTLESSNQWGHTLLTRVEDLHRECLQINRTTKREFNEDIERLALRQIRQSEEIATQQLRLSEAMARLTEDMYFLRQRQ